MITIKASKITMKNIKKESIKLQNRRSADGGKSNSWQLGGKEIFKRKDW